MMQRHAIPTFPGLRARAGLRIALLVLFVGAAGSLLPPRGSASPLGPQDVNLEQFPKMAPEDLPAEYQEFLDQVDAIITADERDVFLRCQTDAKRDTFVERFWKVRDPTPGTPGNEYKDLYFERLEHVEERFGRETPRPGWMTDQGRMYLLLGEPMNTKTLPNTQLAYPIELWFYHADPELGVPPFFNLMFFKPHGSGEYRLYSPLVDGPMKLLNPAGESQARQLETGSLDGGGMMGGGFGDVGSAYDVLQQYVDAEVAQAALSLIPGDGSTTAGMPSLRSAMMIGDIEDIPNRIMPSAAWAYRILTGEVEADVRFETLPLTATATALLDPSGVPFVHWAVRTEGGRLNLNSYEGDYYITFQVAGALKGAQARVVTGVRGPEAEAKLLQVSLEEEDARRIRSGDFIYIDRLPAVPGTFALDLMVENNVSREFGRAELELEIPEPHPGEISSSEPVLVWQVQRLDRWDPYAEQYGFQVGPLGMVPAVEPVFDAGGSLHVFHQIYLPEGSVPDTITTVYRLEDDSGVVQERVDELPAAGADDNDVIHAVGTLELGDVPPGDYRLVIDVEEDARGAATRSVTIREAAADDQGPYVQAQAQPPATDPQVGYRRALQFRALGQTEKAIATLRPVLERAPEFREAFALQTELLMEAGRHREVVDVLTPLAVQNPNDADLLLWLAEASANLNEHYDAIRYYERARRARGEDTPDLLNPLAAEYFADGQADKAGELLELSLELDPEQPEVERLLEQVLRGKPGSGV